MCHEIDHLDGILITDRASGEDIRIITGDDDEDDF
jgi:peptide deformylase